MDRATLAQRLHAAYLDLRDSADVVEGGTAGDVAVDAVVHDAGLIAVLWRGPSDVQCHVEPSGGHLGVNEGLTRARHPGPDAGETARAVFIRHVREGGRPRPTTVAEIPFRLPPWDGGADAGPYHLPGGTLIVKGFDYGGLGGRFEIEVHVDPQSDRSLSLGGMGAGCWLPGDEATAVPPPTPAPPDDGPATLYGGVTGFDDSGSVLSLLTARGSARLVPAVPTNMVWHVRGYQRLHYVVSTGLAPDPESLVLRDAVTWHRLDPVPVYAFDTSHEGRTFALQLPAHGATLELAVAPAHCAWKARVRPAPHVADLWGRDPGGWHHHRPIRPQRRLNGWTHYGIHGGPRQSLTLACTAIGTPLGTLTLPVPRRRRTDEPPAHPLTTGASDGLTPDARNALQTAETLAYRSGDPWVGEEHLMEALLGVLPADFRARVGLDRPETILWALNLWRQPGPPRAPQRLSPSVETALATARDEARAAGRPAATAADLLLGLIAHGEGDAWRALWDVTDPARIRAAMGIEEAPRP